MKSALQLELQDLHGLPYIATIIWFVLLGVCLLAVVFYLLQKNYSNTKSKDEIAPSVKKINQKGFK